MPVTLAQAQVNTQDDVDYRVIDEFRRHSWIWDQLVFDDTVTPGTGGASLTYAYTRLTSPRSASFRAFNSEYERQAAQRARESVDLKPLGGVFGIDRALGELGDAASNEITFQLAELTQSTLVRFIAELINGDTGQDEDGFDGLNVILNSTVTEHEASGGAANISPAAITGQAAAMAALDEIDIWLSEITPSRVGSGDLTEQGAVPPGVKALISNTRMITRIKALARWAGIYTEDKDDVGRSVARYGDWVLVDAGHGPDGSSPIVPLADNESDLYAVTFGLDALHGASPAGKPLVQTWLPDFDTAGAVKNGELEIGPAAIALKNTRSAGVLRGVDLVSDPS